jgi:choline dehydrogenase-like flavoprotein
MSVIDTFDFVVVGGGSGGCTVAGRLSEDPNISVAVLDAGGRNDNWVVTTPFALVLMVAGNVNNWAFNTVPQKGLNGRIGYQPRGKGLGGSSAINAMVYIRGHRSDYDQWASLGNAGWSFADVLPYFKRAENNSDFGGEYHGKGGPLAVNKSRSGNPVQQIFLQAAQEAQFRLREDFNADEHEGLGIYQLTQKNGERCSAARAYIHPHMGSRANLRVEIHAHATRILFEGKRAVGVEYRQGKELKQIHARREVIVSSGAFQTPQLLMLSGVGDSAALGKHGIATVHHLPGVGQNPPVPARTNRAHDVELRRMRRFPENPARSRHSRYPASFRHGAGRRSRPQAPSRHRLHLPRLPAAAEEPRQRFARQCRSVRRAGDRSELLRRGG